MEAISKWSTRNPSFFCHRLAVSETFCINFIHGMGILTRMRNYGEQTSIMSRLSLSSTASFCASRSTPTYIEFCQIGHIGYIYVCGWLRVGEERENSDPPPFVSLLSSPLALSNVPYYRFTQGTTMSVFRTSTGPDKAC